MYRLGWVLGSNNGRATALWILTGLWFIFCLFVGFGEPVVEKMSKGQVSEFAQSKYNQGVYASWNESQKKLAKLANDGKPVKKEKTEYSIFGWGPWKILFLLIVISTVYWVASRREEFVAALKRAVATIEARHAMAEKDLPKPEKPTTVAIGTSSTATTAMPQAPTAASVFLTKVKPIAQFLSIDLIVEAIGHLIKGRKRI